MSLPTLAQPVCRATLACLALALTAGIACDDSTAPGDDGQLRSGQPVRGFAGAAGRELRYQSAPREAFEVHFRGGLKVALYSIRPSGDSLVLSHPRFLDDTATQVFRFVTLEQPHTERLLLVGVDGGGPFQIEVEGQNRLPESRGAGTRLGEQIEEAIDAANDADEFAFTLAEPTSITLEFETLDALSGELPARAFIRPATASPFEQGGPWAQVDVMPGPPTGEVRTSGPALVPAGNWVLVVDREPFDTWSQARLRYRARLVAAP